MSRSNLDGSESQTAPNSDRRKFLLTSGAVAASVAVGASLLDATPASAVSVDTPVYLPIDPFRVYDSRQRGGKIYAGQTQRISRSASGIYAASFNVTVTDTNSGGWLALYPGDTNYAGTSSVNWFGTGQTLANSAYLRVDTADDGVYIRCGSGTASTHFILDLVGVLTVMTLPIFVAGMKGYEPGTNAQYDLLTAPFNS